MTAEEEAGRYVRDGTPAFVDAYDRILELIGVMELRPGDPMPGDVTLAGGLGVTRELVTEALLLLSEDGKLERREQQWYLATPPAGPVAFTDSFHHLLRGDVWPVRRLLVDVEPGSQWAHELLGRAGQVLTWETVFAGDDVLLASTLEMMALEAVPPALLEPEALLLEKHDLAEWPTMLSALDGERRARFTPEVWRLSSVSRRTERLSWMELPLHGIPAALTVVLAEDGVPVYLAKNLFDLGTFDLVVDQQVPPGPVTSS